MIWDVKKSKQMENEPPTIKLRREFTVALLVLRALSVTSPTFDTPNGPSYGIP